MKRTTVIVIALTGLALAGWDFRNSFNRPRSVVINTATNNLKTAFDTTAGSLVMQNLSNGQFQNMMIINETAYPLSVLTLPEVSAAPSATVTGQRLHVVSFGSGTFDNVSIFDNMYIQSESTTGNIGKIKINVW